MGLFEIDTITQWFTKNSIFSDLILSIVIVRDLSKREKHSVKPLLLILFSLRTDEAILGKYELQHILLNYKDKLLNLTFAEQKVVGLLFIFG